jgi:hypothetical protein
MAEGHAAEGDAGLDLRLDPRDPLAPLSLARLLPSCALTGMWPRSGGVIRMRLLLLASVAFAMEVVALAERGQPIVATVYVVASVGLSIAGCLLGLLAVRTI